jgi:hypothetical protein
VPVRGDAVKVRPISLNAARGWIATVHRHLRRPVTGWLFGIEILDADGTRIGVAMAGRPKARLLQDGVTLEITRVAVLEGHPNACSKAYGALRRAGLALGYQRFYTYIRDDEDGASLRAAGFVDDGPAGGGQASRPSRPRQESEDPSPKRRYVWPAEARGTASAGYTSSKP